MSDSRLFQILYYLLDKGHATAPELAAAFEVSVRTIYRDIEALSSANIPVYTETGRNGGVYLMNDFVLDKAIFSEKEKKEMLTMLQSISATGYVSGKETLTKLSALFHVDIGDWLEVDFSRWGDHPYDNFKFETLKTAAIRHQTVKIIYESASSGRSERTLWPLKLSYKSQGWYLKAFCLERQDFRTFKLNRILNLELLEEHFIPMSYPDPANTPLKTSETQEALGIQETQKVSEVQEDSGTQKVSGVLKDSETQNSQGTQTTPQIILSFSKEGAYRVYDEFDDSQIERQTNGDLIAYANMPVDQWLIGYLLSFGTQVEILKPQYLKEILAKQAFEIYEKNKP